MSDWKSRVDAYKTEIWLQQKKHEQKGELLTNILGTVFSTIGNIIESLLDTKDVRKTANLSRFHCHVKGCTVVSRFPGEREVGQRYEPGWDYQKGTYFPIMRSDFSIPGDLVRCEKCGGWTCTNPDHLHNGICVECGKRL